MLQQLVIVLVLLDLKVTLKFSTMTTYASVIFYTLSLVRFAISKLKEKICEKYRKKFSG